MNTIPHDDTDTAYRLNEGADHPDDKFSLQHPLTWPVSRWFEDRPITALTVAALIASVIAVGAASGAIIAFTSN